MAGRPRVALPAPAALLVQTKLSAPPLRPNVVHRPRLFDPFTTGENALLWTGESGLLTAAVLLALAFASSRIPYTMLRAVPREAAPMAGPAVSRKAA